MAIRRKGINTDLTIKKTKKGRAPRPVHNPYDEDFIKLSKEEMYKDYETVLKRVKSRMRELEKKGLQNSSAVYRSLIENEEKTKTGKTSFKQKLYVNADKGNYDKYTKSEYIREYKRIYKAYVSKTSTYQGAREVVADTLSAFGEDLEELEKIYTQEQIDDLITRMWNLVHSIEGYMKEVYGFSVSDVRDVVNKFIDTKGVDILGTEWKTKYTSDNKPIYPGEIGFTKNAADEARKWNVEAVKHNNILKHDYLASKMGHLNYNEDTAQLSAKKGRIPTKTEKVLNFIASRQAAGFDYTPKKSFNNNGRFLI